MESPYSNRPVEEVVKDLEDYRKNDYRQLVESIKNADFRVTELSVRSIHAGRTSQDKAT